MINTVINWKLQDAHTELRNLKRRNTATWREVKATIRNGGVLREYERLWRRETTKYDEEIRSKHRKKIRHLQRKYKTKPNTIPDEIDGIVIKDQEIPEGYSSTPRTYGGITLTNEEETLLSLPPKYATYNKVNTEECEAEVEKCLAKLRWEDRNSSAQNELPREERNWHDHTTKTMDFRHFRSTNLKFNARITVPKPLDDMSEVNMQSLKQRLNRCTEEYVKETRHERVNLTAEQKEGLKTLKEKKKDCDIIIMETDKSKRFSCDTPDNYKLLASTHMENDEVVTQETKALYEKQINAHTGMWLLMLRAGTEVNDVDRVKQSMTSHNNIPAPLSILRKDHKPSENDVIGPPGRPVCGGDVSYNKRLSNLISTILTDVYIGEPTVCSSTEELLAEVERVNEEGLDEMDIIGSADVEALYPSLDIDFTIDKVCELLHDSTVTIEGMDYKELGLYLSLNKSDEQLRQLGLDNVCPKRRTNRGPRPVLTGCGMAANAKDRHQPWIFPNLDGVTEETKRKMMVEAMRIVLKALMEKHVYEFAKELKRQRKGGAIGMELTGVVAQIFMVWWDRQLRSRLEMVDFKLKMHERYVDDSNVLARRTEVGARYDGERVIVTDESVQEDRDLPDDERTMKLMQSIAAHIHPSIRLTIDYPSKHPEKKVPMLDVKMWIEELDNRRLLLYEHYEKPMATKSVVHEQSAIPTKNKRTILTQEVLRILLHCSSYLPWEVPRTHINNFMLKMQYSGYGKMFRYHVVNGAINAYQKIREKEDLGIRPMHRPKNWERESRRKEKETKRKNWYKDGGFDSVVFIAMTRNGELKRRYEREIRKSGLRIKVVERTGRTLKSQLQTSNPFREANCGRNDCFVCTTSNTGNCNTESVTYDIKCEGDDCTEREEYRGESANNGYTRGKIHIRDLNAKDIKNSPLWRHCVEKHNGQVQNFTMAINGTYRNDTMMRQVTEAVQINNLDPRHLMNTRAEWNMTRVPRASITAD